MRVWLKVWQDREFIGHRKLRYCVWVSISLLSVRKFSPILIYRRIVCWDKWKRFSTFSNFNKWSFFVN